MAIKIRGKNRKHSAFFRSLRLCKYFHPLGQDGVERGGGREVSSCAAQPLVCAIDLFLFVSLWSCPVMSLTPIPLNRSLLTVVGTAFNDRCAPKPYPTLPTAQPSSKKKLSSSRKKPLQHSLASSLLIYFISLPFILYTKNRKKKDFCCHSIFSSHFTPF